VSPDELDEVLARALEIARRAAALLRDGHGGTFSVDHKGDVDLVTEHDLRSEELIVEGLRAAFPGHGVLAEEGGQQGAGTRATWLVDPLDGTTNYAHRLPFYTVSLALELDGELAVALVLAPELGWELTARRGGGARLNGEPVRVSEVSRLDSALLATGFPYDRRTSADNNVPQFAAVIRRAQGIRRVGVASLDCAMVAAGFLDGYWEYKLQAWDIAAGALLVLEAGGTVTDGDGGRYRPRCTDIVASNGRIHEELLEVLRAVPRPGRC
jgi:myo-inositol-1(or 4)-monophosphatase